MWNGVRGTVTVRDCDFSIECQLILANLQREPIAVLPNMRPLVCDAHNAGKMNKQIMSLRVVSTGYTHQSDLVRLLVFDMDR